VTPKGNSLCKTCHRRYRLLTLVHLFLHSSSCYPSPKILLCAMLFSRSRRPKSAPHRGRIYVHLMHVPWTHPTQHYKLHLDRFSCFRTAYGRVPIYHTTTTVLRPFFQDHPGEPVPEENFWTLWCKGSLTEADTPTIRLGATPSKLTSAYLHHPPIRVPI